MVEKCFNFLDGEKIIETFNFQTNFYSFNIIVNCIAIGGNKYCMRHIVHVGIHAQQPFCFFLCNPKPFIDRCICYLLADGQVIPGNAARFRLSIFCVACTAIGARMHSLVVQLTVGRHAAAQGAARVTARHVISAV